MSVNETMQSNIHPTMKTIPFNCTGCGASMKITGAYHDDSISNEQCSNCHHAYTGKRRITKTRKVEEFAKKYQSFSGRISRKSSE